LKISFLGKKMHLPRFIKRCQCGVAKNLQMVELQMGYSHGAYRLQGKQHILLALLWNSENKMGTKLKTTCRLYPQGGIVKIGKTVIAIEELQTPFVDSLQTQFKKTFLAGFSHQISQWPEERIGHTIRPCREYQANAVDICQKKLKYRQQPLNRHGGAGFLLEIGKVFFEPALEKMPLPFGKLFGNVTHAPQVGRGKTCRSTENAAAMEAIGARLPQIEGNFPDPVAKLLVIVITEGAENRRCHGFRR